MTSTKTFRLFISSTFSDFRQERQVLHEKVFPVIEKYCSDQGYQFQPVDLRWGVSAEAQLDQKTLELCLNEVRACKHFPHPNFLIMLGNRYGWIPLPYAIEKSEFELILKFYPKDSNEEKLLTDWYIEDTNHIMETSYAYVLKQREPDGAYKDWQDWEKLENELRSSLQEAVNTIFPNKEDPQYRKYFLSATEAEVEEGIYQYLQPTQKQLKLADKENKELPILDYKYVYGWIRNIDDIDSYDKTVEPAKSFIDVDQTPLKGFKTELRKVIASDNLIEPTVSLTQDKEKPIDDSAYLESFIDFMTKKLIASVKQQILEAKQISDLEQERFEQKVFKDQKNEIFLGRQAQISQIASYINKPSHQPYIVHGISGIGKSAFMAEVVSPVERLNEESKKNKSIEYRPLVYRFIGATASSSNIRSLLELLIEDLADQNVLVKPESFEADSNKFNEQIKQLLVSIEKPTIIILDALDQLQHNDWLQWLPLELSSHLKIILSMLDQENYDHYFKLLAKKIDKLNQLAIEPLDEEGVAKQILEALLEKEQRSITDTQFQYVIDQYTNNESSPLYLKIAFEEVKLWKSSDSDQTLSNKRVQGIIKEFIDNLSGKYHHDKTIVHKILGLIAASRDGLSEKEILDLLSRDEAILNKLEKFNKLTLTIEGKEIRRFPISIWSRLHTQLKPFLNERLIDGQSLITFFHRQITEAVYNHIYKNNAQELHKELEDYFLTLQDETKTWDKRYYNPHMLTETPYQLFHAKDSQILKEILFDLEFAGSVYDHHKQESFKAIMEQASKLDGISQDEIYPWESFYREKEHLIYRVDEELWRPHQSLFQLVYEDGNDSPLSQASDDLLNRNRIDFIWLKKKNRLLSYLRSGAIKTVHPYNNLAKWCVQIDENVLVSYGEDCNVYLWNISSNILIKLGSFGDKKYLEFIIIKIPNGNFIIYNQLHKSFDYDDYDEPESLKDMQLKRKYLETDKKAYEIDKIGNVTLTYNFIDEYLENIFVIDENYFLFLYRNGKIFLYKKNNKNVIEYTKSNSYSEEYHSCFYFRNDQIIFIDLNEKYLIENYKDLVYFSTEINPFATNNILLNSDSMLKGHEIEVDNSHYVKCELNGSLRLFKKSSLIKKNDFKDEIDEFSLTSLINMAFNGSAR